MVISERFFEFNNKENKNVNLAHKPTLHIAKLTKMVHTLQLSCLIGLRSREEKS